MSENIPVDISCEKNYRFHFLNRSLDKSTGLLKRTYFIPKSQWHIINEIQSASKDNIRLTNDCEITNVIFSRIIDGNYIERGLNYLSLYKILKSLGCTNDEINTYIEDNIWIIEDFRMSLDEAKTLINNIEKKDVKTIIDELYVHIKSKKILKGFFFLEETKNVLTEGLKNKILTSPLNVNNVSKINDLEKNVHNLCKLNKVLLINELSLAQTIIENTETLSIVKPSVLIDYISVLAVAGLDLELITKNNLSKINEFLLNNITPTKLYCYVGKLKDKTDVPTLEGLDMLIEMYTFDELRKEYSVFYNNLPIILKLKTEYLTKIKEKLLENKNTSFVQEKKE